MVDARLTLQRLIEERGEDYASLSRLIARNSAYIQQFIRRGVPRKLDENDRRLLAAYFGVDERLLGGPDGGTRLEPSAEAPPASGDSSLGAKGLCLIPPFKEARRGTAPPVTISLDPAYLATFTLAASRRLVSVRIHGDSMAPTLGDGDLAIIDLADARGQLRDGLYLLSAANGAHVKRITLHPEGLSARVSSDNPSYASWPECRTSSLPLIGRLVWMGRRLP